MSNQQQTQQAPQQGNPARSQVKNKSASKPLTKLRSLGVQQAMFLPLLSLATVMWGGLGNEVTCSAGAVADVCYAEGWFTWYSELIIANVFSFLWGWFSLKDVDTVD